MRSQPASYYGTLALVASCALGAVLVFGFPFCFAPGWANGWPGGFTIYRVWSAGMTAYVFAMMMTAGIGIGALIALPLRVFPPVRRHAALIFCAWLVLWTSFTALACTMAYHEIYASTLVMWPNGYPSGVP
jgi:hypothetical protein